MRNRETTANVVDQRAKELRGQMPLAEKRLWKHLRAKQMNGLRFRRQEPVGNYIADFYCAAVKLVIELDGDSHSERAEADALRDEVLRSEGYTVLRFHNAQIFNDLTGVLETIELTVNHLCSS
jgi:very-short-patch-repair endonuclease